MFIRFIGFLLLITGAVLFSIGQWIAFEVYVNDKLTKISQNMAQFTYSLHSGESLIKIPNALENIFLIRDQDGKVVVSDNTTAPLKVEDFTFAERSKGGTYVYVYVKKINVEDYLSLLAEKPLVLGVSLSGLILFFFGLFLTLRHVGLAKTWQEVEDESLIKSLKALRVSLAMGELIPRESLQEAKRIVEDIIKKMEGKK